MNIHEYYGYFFSIRFLFKGLPNVAEYTLDFLKNASILSYSIFLFLILFSYFFLKENKFGLKKQGFKHSFLLSLLSFLLFFTSLFIGESKSQFESSFELLMKPYYQELTIEHVGLMPFLFSDLKYLFFKDKPIIIPESDVIDAFPAPTAPSLKRVVDDRAWRIKAKEEKNSLIADIDTFLFSREITDKNNFTGLYEDKNLIYFLVEAFDMIAIHPQLTPTLFKLKEEGIYFDEFYSPQYNCATAESELMSLSSMYPVIGTCTMSAYYKQASSQNLFQLFKKKGYKTLSFHNWNDQFYPRSTIHPVLGSDAYYDLKDMIPNTVSGWQSDLTMMVNLIPILNQETLNSFFAYVITSSTHLPYDTDTHLSMKHRDKVETVYPDAPYEIKNYLSKAIELDLAIEYLLKNLGEIDDTVLVLFSDHRPLRMAQEHLNDFSAVDRFSMNDIDKTPMIIFYPNQKPQTISKKSSTIDLAPTLANLFNLDYDPRLFMGQDLFGEDDPVVIFQNGNFYDQNGYYSASKGSYTPEDIGLEMKQDISTIKTKLEVSSAIYLEKYFTLRKDYFK